MAIQYLLPTTSGATYRALGDWLVRQGRVHLANYGCCSFLEGRDGDCPPYRLAPSVFEKMTEKKVQGSLFPQADRS
jgi:hypothetical protein